MTLRWTGTVVALLAAWGLGCDGGGGGSGSQDTAPLPDAMAEVAPDTGIPDTVPEVGPDTVEPPDSVPELVPDIPAPPDTLDTVEADAPQPCATHVECDDGDPCTGDFCTGGACTHQAKNCSDANLCTTDLCSLETGQCYYQLVDCDDGDECTLDSCKPATGCEHLAVNGCCEPDVVAEWGFEEEIPGLDIVNLQEEESPGVTWSVSTARAASGAASLYFGDPETLTYDSGHRVRALALLPPVTVPAGFDAELRVRVWPDVEQSKDWDTFTVLVQVGEQRLPVLVKNLQTDYQAWNEWTVLLNPFAGQSVRVGFHFDSMDGGDNLGEGIYVDDVRLAARCPVASPCIAKVDCSDMNNCTAEACQAGACVYTPDWNCCLSPTHCDD
ncbi:MAG: hypothetical protein FJ098_16530, partial [Deltaproteobacteria bacterium]|nr:hypothetical protein [Deltaproteobacteria bacterium]